ncbi:MAG TPA: T9SS type A sorting domain-containing protein [Chitinophagales bacterium]|nr:T9SS type A sorting domain-containing protein [Chitinophagales bacterium]
MKRNFLLLLALTIFSVPALSQYYYIPFLSDPGNPGGLNPDSEYPVGGGLPAGWTPIASTGNLPPSWSSIETLPFAFSFNGNAVTQFKASTTGVVTFDVNAVAVPSAYNSTLPDASIPDNSIMAWGIQSMGVNDNICTKVFGTAPNRQYWIFYTSYSSNNDSAHYVYWSIVLEETSNNIYVVDQRNNSQDQDLTVGIQINSAIATEVTGSPLIDAFSGSDPTEADNNYYKFIHDAQFSLNMTATNITMHPYQSFANPPFFVTGKLLNEGSATITSFDINYSIDGGAPITAPVSGVSIVFGSQYDFIHPTAWTPSSTADYTVTIWASNLNGGNDEDPADDQLSTIIHVVPVVTQLTPLFEEFTSSTCPPCAVNNPIFDALLEDNPGKFTCVKYQMSWPPPGDDYYNPDGETRRTLYGVTGIPDLEVDGINPGVPPAYYTNSNFDQEYYKPSYMTIDATYTITDSTVSVNSTITPLIDFTGAIKAFIAVVENPTHNNASTNGETEFTYVEQKMLPNGVGTLLLDLTANSVKTVDKSYTFSASSNVEDYGHLLVVEWVQNLTTHEVYQSAFATLVTGQQEIDNVSSGIINVFPNPATDVSDLFFQLEKDDVVSLKIMNTLGQPVYASDMGMMHHGNHHASMCVSDLSNGIYFISLQIGKNIYRSRLVVQQ